MKKLFKGRAGKYAVPLTLFYVLVNVLLFIVITAFAQDGTVVGQATGQGLDIDGNTSTDEDISITKASGWTGSFRTTLHGLPWWLNTLFVVFEVSIGALAVYALIRGL